MEVMKFRNALFILNLLLVQFLMGQVAPKVLNFTKVQYHGGNQNWFIDQAPNDFMLFGNSSGMMVFNGTTWVSYPLPENQIVRALSVAKSGDIYVGGYEEFGVWKRDEEGRIQYYSLSDELPMEEILNDEIWNIVIQGNKVYFQSFGKIYVYDEREKTSPKPLDLATPNGIMLIQNIGNRLYFQAIKGGLFEIKSDGSVIPLPKSEGLSDFKVVFMLPYKYYGILIGTENNGMFLYANEKLTQWENESNSAFRKNKLNKGTQLSNGLIAIGTTLNGLYILDTTGKLVHKITMQNGLQNNTILSMKEDTTGNLWLGLDNGIDLISLNENLTYFTDFSGEIGTVYSAVIFENRLYLATNLGLFVKTWSLDYFEMEKNQFRLVNGSEGHVWNVMRVGNSVVGAHNDFAFQVLGDSIHKFYHGGTWDITEASNSSSLFLGTYSGIVVSDFDNGLWKYSHHLQVPRVHIKKLRFGERGELWAINPYNRIYQIDLEGGEHSANTWKLLGSENHGPTGLNTDISLIGSTLILKSEQSLYKIGARNNNPVRLTEIRGITIPDVEHKLFSGIEDEWFQSFEKHVKFYGKHDTLKFNLSLVKNHERIVSLDRDHYLFCLDNGYAIFNRNNTLSYPPQKLLAPAIYRIERFGGKNESLSFAFRGSDSQPLNFSPRVEKIVFHFSLPEFTRNSSYRTKLEGYDNYWSEWSDHAYQEYENLPAGDYTFTVASKETPAISSVSFTIESDWYETSSFRILSVLLLLLAGGASMFYIAKRIDLKKRKAKVTMFRKLHQENLIQENEKLKKEVIVKQGVITNNSKQLVKKNETLTAIQNQLIEIKQELGVRFPDKYLKILQKMIDSNVNANEDWEFYEADFSKVHQDFFKKLKQDFPDITNSELKLASYIKMNLSSKQIAHLLSVSHGSLENKRSFLRKKMNLEKGQNLTEYIILNY